ncbi:MAG: VapC toxin family PIN domain ribonuclease [Spirochaetae bacterium HGW-Spirochaetae-5]|nr:MAG: VapC toxin family PIN domain ribonuclease [Spirochaetae bacterium HGW-Spirochaetae-5]
MSGRYLLDTNIIIDLFNGVDAVTKKLINADEVFVPNVVIGELYFGLYGSKKTKSNIKRLEDFILSSTVINTNIETARIYGYIKNELKKKGTPIPENDIWIAALAKQHSLKVLTRDKHFKSVDNIDTDILNNKMQ